MKKQVYTMIGALVFATLCTVSTARAQSANRPMTANIPFAFSAGNQTLPAGEYSVTCTNPTSAQKVLQIRSKDGRKSVMLQTNDVIGKVQDGAKLVFNRYGDRYFLAQAWPAADNTGMQATKSRAERDIASQLASNERKITTVALSRR